MRKISSYLYPNRIQLLADLAGFTTEYTNVYQRTVKLYKGVDNVIEFDIKNADQKRIGLVDSFEPAYTAPFTDLKLNVMDASGNSVGQYDINVDTGIKGIAKTTIPADDLTDLDHQFFHYSVTATDTDDNNIPLYADSRFGAVGTIELVGNAMPTTRKSVVFDRFAGEINFEGDIINHTSVIPAKYYEAVPTQSLSFSIEMTDYVGEVYLEATKDSTISVESFRTEHKNALKVASHVYTTPNSTTLEFNDVSTEGWNYFRISWKYLDPVLLGVYSQYPTGTVDKVTIS